MQVLKSEDLSTNVENTNSTNSSKNEELRRIEKLKDTPFEIVYDEGVGYYLVMGSYRITEPNEKRENLIKIVKEKNWNLLTTVIAVITEQIKKGEA